MDPLDSQVVQLLTYLLPGFIAAAVVYTLTPSPRPAPFERVVQALIYTVLIQVAVLALQTTFSYVGNRWFVLGVWTESVRVTWSVVLAGLLGLLIATASNHDTIHKFLRNRGITYQTSYSSEWYGALAQNDGYVVLHLSGDRRLYGWPEEWPNTPDVGHFVMSQAEWLDSDTRIPLTNVKRVMVRAADVQMIEFMGRL